jgi:hypothetical protein
MLQGSLGTIKGNRKINGIKIKVKCDKRIKDKNMRKGQYFAFCVCHSNS